MAYKTRTLQPALHRPSIAQLVERWTVEASDTEIHRSLVQIRLEGVHIFLHRTRQLGSVLSHQAILDLLSCQLAL